MSVSSFLSEALPCWIVAVPASMPFVRFFRASGLSPAATAKLIIAMFIQNSSFLSSGVLPIRSDKIFFIATVRCLMSIPVESTPARFKNSRDTVSLALSGSIATLSASSTAIPGGITSVGFTTVSTFGTTTVSTFGTTTVSVSVSVSVSTTVSVSVSVSTTVFTSFGLPSRFLNSSKLVLKRSIILSR